MDAVTQTAAIQAEAKRPFHQRRYYDNHSQWNAVQHRKGYDSPFISQGGAIAYRHKGWVQRRSLRSMFRDNRRQARQSMHEKAVPP